MKPSDTQSVFLWLYVLSIAYSVLIGAFATVGIVTVAKALVGGAA